MRQEGSIEGTLKVKMYQGEGGREKKWKRKREVAAVSLEIAVKDTGSAGSVRAMHASLCRATALCQIINIVKTDLAKYYFEGFDLILFQL